MIPPRFQQSATYKTEEVYNIINEEHGVKCMQYRVAIVDGYVAVTWNPSIRRRTSYLYCQALQLKRHYACYMI